MYKLCANGVLLNGITFVPESVENKQYQEYQKWIALGNTPDPIDPPAPAQIIYKEKNSIILQIVQAGKYDLAEIELAKLPNWQQALWNGAYKIAYDDAIVRGILATIGMDAETVMATATNFGN